VSSKLITENYSTSFTLGIKTLIAAADVYFAIYGVTPLMKLDTFHDFDKENY
jgi:hypothetical protein